MVSLALALMAAPAQAKPRPCGLKGKVVAASAKIAVVKRGQGDTRSYDACWRANRKFFDILNRDSDDLVSHIRVTGRYVAWYSIEADMLNRPEVAVINVVNPRDGDDSEPRSFVLYDGAQPTLASPDSPLYGGIEDLILTADGDAAWIARRPAPDTDLEVRYGTYRLPVETRTLGRAPDIVPGSLAVGAHDVYWRQTDGAHTAPR